MGSIVTVSDAELRSAVLDFLRRLSAGTPVGSAEVRRAITAGLDIRVKRVLDDLVEEGLVRRTFGGRYALSQPQISEEVIEGTIIEVLTLYGNCSRDLLATAVRIRCAASDAAIQGVIDSLLSDRTLFRGQVGAVVIGLNDGCD